MTDQSGDVYGKRYGEVLLLRMVGPARKRRSTTPFRSTTVRRICGTPDAEASPERTAPPPLLNGPRYWLMSRIGKKPANAAHQDVRRHRDDRAGHRPDGVEQPAPYSVNRVDRRAVFTFDAGRPVFELVDPTDGAG